MNYLPGKHNRQQDAEATTHVSPVNVQQGRAPAQNHYANTDPNMAHQQAPAPHADAYSVADGDGRNRGAQAGNVAANAAEQKQKGGKKVNTEDLRRMVEEENATKGKLPRYPGLERWELIEKMGDGAFSNVYRARDLDGKAGEVAIKVVRKFEMNSNQVCISTATA